MGNISQGFKCMCTTTLFFLFLLSYSTVSSHSSNQEIQPQNPSSTTPAHYYQLFYPKNTNPVFSSRSQERFKKRRIKRNKNKKHRKKKKDKNLELRPFSVMLPKGFVPPSGSSPCHNDQPNSVSFECHLTAAEP